MEVIHVAEAGDGSILVTYMLTKDEFADIQKEAADQIKLLEDTPETD